MARRTSYASALAGPAGSSDTTPSRSGFMSNSAQTIGASQYSVTSSSNTGPFVRPSDRYRSYLGRNGSPDPFESDAGALQAGKWSDTLEATVLDSNASPSSPSFFIPSYLRGSPYVDRLEELSKAREKTQREGRSSRSSVAGGSRSRSGSGVNSSQKMVPSHRGMTYEIQEKFDPSPEVVDTLPLPSRWSSHDKFSALEVSPDGIEVKFTGQSKTSSKNDAALVRADHSIPRACGVYYFEITVMGRAKEGVGLTPAKASLERPPGWEEKSYAYHGDDGNKFGGQDRGAEYGPKFGNGDIVGCGIDFSTGSVFFTWNGIHKGVAFKDVSGEKFFPTVGLRKTGEHVKVNLGQEAFAFDIDGMVESERESLRRRIEKEPASSLHPTNASESQLMQELIGQYLSHEGYTETTKAFAAEVKQNISLLRGPEAAETSTIVYEEDPEAIKRQKIRSAVLEGRVQDAIDLTDRWYSNVLRDNENIYFKLRCRKFIELIKKSADLQPRSSRRATSSNSPFKRHSKHASVGSVGTNGHAHKSHDSIGSMDVDRDYDSLDMPVAASDDVHVQQITLMGEALSYGRKLQNEFKDDPRREVKQALEDTFALIAYSDARNSSLAYLLGENHRVPVAEELNSAILISLGQSSTAALERLVNQTDVLLTAISADGSSGALLHLNKHYLR